MRRRQSPRYVKNRRFRYHGKLNLAMMLSLISKYLSSEQLITFCSRVVFCGLCDLNCMAEK